ncbi:MAG TPA: glycosyltransferase family 9 protein [Thermodesulfobacteriota bacterium]|mgnify:CR=1 FL=1|nr:glycosyltransferase family 9 protein [Thermodesulfobacteriota bacterium]
MNWKIEGLKRIDGILGGIACGISRLIVSPGKGPHNTPLKILVIRPGGIGDAVLLYPALSALRREFPGSPIHVLAEKRNAGILVDCPYIDGVLLYDSSPLGTLAGVVKEGYDIVIDTEQWHRMTAALAYLTRAPVRAGFATNERARQLTHTVPHGRGDYEAVSFLNLVSAVTGKEYAFDEDKPFLPIDPSKYGKILSALDEFKSGKRGVVGIFTGATVKERRWGTRKFAGLAKALAEEGLGVVLLGGPGDVESSAEVKKGLDCNSVLDLAGKTPLMETAAVISTLDLLVSGDTGLMHIAYGAGTPTVSLFGAGIEEKWAPRGHRHAVINKRLPCSPCTEFGYTPPCPYGVRCLREISVEEVKESVLDLLSLASTSASSG